tara:strand:+ start:2097 stop:2327 length:231 start_codon:yes stop_codon:yes gene_type:complete
MTKKKKVKAQAPITAHKDPNVFHPDPVSQFKVEKAVDDDKKVRPKQVFENYSEPNRPGHSKTPNDKKKVKKVKKKV